MCCEVIPFLIIFAVLVVRVCRPRSYTVAYLECAKGGNPGGPGDGSPPVWGPGTKPR